MCHTHTGSDLEKHLQPPVTHLAAPLTFALISDWDEDEIQEMERKYFSIWKVQQRGDRLNLVGSKVSTTRPRMEDGRSVIHGAGVAAPAQSTASVLNRRQNELQWVEADCSYAAMVVAAAVLRVHNHRQYGGIDSPETVLQYRVVWTSFAPSHLLITSRIHHSSLSSPSPLTRHDFIRHSKEKPFNMPGWIKKLTTKSPKKVCKRPLS